MPTLIIWTFLFLIAISIYYCDRTLELSTKKRNTMLLIKRNDWIRMSLMEIMKINNKWHYDYKYTNLKLVQHHLQITDTDHHRTLMLSYTQFSIFVLWVLWWSHTLLYCSLTWTLAHHLISQAAAVNFYQSTSIWLAVNISTKVAILISIISEQVVVLVVVPDSTGCWLWQMNSVQSPIGSS